jgi:hypothetical protein
VDHLGVSEVTKRLCLSAVAGLIALVALSVGTASADPSTPVPPPPPATSTPDELADMVMDAIAHDSPAPSVPSPAPAPPH